MNRLASTLGLAALVGLAACDKTDECRQLEKLKGEYEVAAVRMRARAGFKDKALERAKVAEEKAKETLQRLGLDKNETELDAVLRDRAKALGVTVERGSRDVPLGDGEGLTERQTVWSFELSAKDSAGAVDQARRLAGSPPLFRYVALLSNDDEWRLRLGRAEVDQIDLEKIAAAPPPERRKAADIPAEMGFCGASSLRSEIATLDAEIEKLQAEAAETTKAMPRAASWEGIRRRTVQIQAEEGQAREILDDLLTAAVRADVKVKAAGVEGAVVILELFGGPKDKIAFQKKLSPQRLETLRPADSARPGLIRYMTLIPAADFRRKAQGHEQHQR